MELDDPRLTGGSLFPQPAFQQSIHTPAGGITLRQHFAGLAMQGLAAHNDNAYGKNLITLAVMMADALIEALAESK